MTRPAVEVADIFRDHGAAWRRANAGRLSLGQLKVMSAIETCRTAALGGHVEACEDYAISRRIDARLTLAALKAEITGRRPPPGCIHHSDNEYGQAGARVSFKVSGHHLLRRAGTLRRVRIYADAMRNAYVHHPSKTVIFWSPTACGPAKGGLA